MAVALLVVSFVDVFLDFLDCVATLLLLLVVVMVPLLLLLLVVVVPLLLSLVLHHSHSVAPINNLFEKKTQRIV